MNGPPVANDDSVATATNVPVDIDVLADDTDPDGDPLTVTGVAPATTANGGTVMINANGTVRYVPGSNFAGTDSFTYSISDGQGGTATATVTVTVLNSAPVAVDDSASTPASTAIVIDVLANDSDPNMDALTVTAAGPASSGTVAIIGAGPNNQVQYTPNAGFTGTDMFSYTIEDPFAASATATVTVTVTTRPPTATIDAYMTPEDTALIVAAPGVLVNDSDPDGDPITAVLVGGVSNGTLTLNADGSFTYTSGAEYNGSDSFTYQASDGTLNSATTLVTLTVTPVNDPPAATADAYATSEDTMLTVAAPGVLGNDTDLEGDTLSAVLGMDVSNGTLTLNADGSFTYTPDADTNGPDSFTYQANDGTANSNTVTVTLTVAAVNDAPVAAGDADSTPEDTPLVVTAPGVLGNDTDVDGDPLTASLVGGVSNGTLTLNADGSYTYTPSADFNGSDSFTYQANDGTVNSNTATVTVTVTAVNDAPVGVGDSYSTPQGMTLNETAPGVLGNDTDPEGDSLTASLVSGPSDGMVTLNPDGSFAYTPNGGFTGTDTFSYQADDGMTTSAATLVTVTVGGSNTAPVAVGDADSTPEDTPLVVAAPGVLVNDTDADGDPLTAALVGGVSNGTLTLNSDGSYTYTPNADYNGSDSFTYQANDGTANSNIVTVTLTVTPVNDPPVAIGDADSTPEDTPLVVAAPGVLGNDTDVDGDPLTASLVGGVSNGTLTLNPDGSYTYTPNADYDGPDSFTYQANDGTANSNTVTVTLTVTAVNDPPVAMADADSTPEDTALVVAAPGVLGNDTDADGDPLTAALVGGVSNGTLTLNADGSYTYTPNADINGSDSFTYQANDGTANSATVTVSLTISSVNDPPVAADDTASTGKNLPVLVAVLANDTDPEGDALTVSAVGTAANGTPVIDAGNLTVTYTPNTGFTGTDTFTYTASDGTDTDTATVTVTVTNTAPTANDDTASTPGDVAVTVSVLANDLDANGDALTVSAVGTAANGTAVIDTGNLTVTYTPNTAFTGTDMFTYTASDGTDTDTATVTVTVLPPIPSAPTGVTAKAGDGLITVSWDTVGGLTYNIYRATQGGVTKGNWSSLPGGTKHADVASPFDVTGLTNGETWYFVVTAENASGESLESTEVLASPATLYDVTTIADGGSYCLALKSDSSVWAWGNNVVGTLGDGSFNYSALPVQVGGGTPLTLITAISASGSHALALDSNGTVWAWGDGLYGQLGNGTSGSTARSNVPVQVTGITTATAIASRGDHSLALLAGGTVVAWGRNTRGQLGDGTNVDRSVPVAVSGLANVSAIDGGTHHSLALLGDGTARTWGHNFYGQLGNGASGPGTDSNVPMTVTGLATAAAIIARGHHCLALLADGTVQAWGYNAAGQLGDGTTVDKSTPAAVSALTGVTDLGAGVLHSLALKSDGTAWSWGWNKYGQLGTGDRSSSSVPVAVSGLGAGIFTEVAGGRFHSQVLRNDGTVWGWGDNLYGQLGNGTFGFENVPAQVGGLLTGVTITAVDGGIEHSLALDSSGNVWAWGYNTLGQLGDGSTTSTNTPVQVSGLSGITAIAAGGYHSIALKSDGTVWAWGLNNRGQIGLDSNLVGYSTIPLQLFVLITVAEIAAGENHCLARKIDGTVWAWGDNTNGQLGSTGPSAYIPRQVSGLAGVSAIAAGWDHSLAVVALGGGAWSWGSNGRGELGNGATLPGADLDTPTPVLTAAATPLTGVSDVAAGISFSMALRSGEVWTWGRNSSGQLGNGSSGPGTDSSYAAMIPSPTGVTEIGAGGYHALALQGGGTLWAWGNNFEGQLGTDPSTFSSSNVPVAVPGIAATVTAPAGGTTHSLVVGSGSAWTWGDNRIGQLGTGSFGHTLVPELVSGP